METQVIKDQGLCPPAQLRGHQTRPCPGSELLLYRASPRCTFEITILSPNTNSHCFHTKTFNVSSINKRLQLSHQEDKGLEVLLQIIMMMGGKGWPQEDHSLALSLWSSRTDSTYQGPFWITDLSWIVYNDSNNGFLMYGMEIIISMPYKIVVSIKWDNRCDALCKI